MRMFRRGLVGLVIATGSCTAANAQNFVQNPNFDADLSSWETTIGTSWSSAHDHSDLQSGTGGSLQISTTTSDSAKQCIAAQSNATYVFDAWIRKDPNPQFAPCSNPSWQVSRFWFSDASCTIFSGGSVDSSIGDISTNWFEVRQSVTSTSHTRAFQVTLSASCGVNNGAATIYFDDVALLPDDIFQDSFEGPDPAKP
jgi:hypothetical protein